MGPKEDISAKKQIKQEDENQREFRCKCKKTYKSYPALYTHIKNKHRDQIEEYKLESKRPKESQIDKGRPKKHRARPVQADEQGDLLNIIELGVLQIESNLKNASYTDQDKFQVLVGNKKLEYNDLKNHYDKQKEKVIQRIKQVYAEQEVGSVIDGLIGRDLNDLKTEIPVKIYKESIKFKQQLIQHFNAITAAKILLHLELLDIQQNNTQTNKINENNQITFSIDIGSAIKLGEDTLWGNIEGIAETIRGTVKKWKEKLTMLGNKSSYVSNNVSQQSGGNDDEEQFQGQNDSEKQEQNQQRHDQIMGCINSNY